MTVERRNSVRRIVRTWRRAEHGFTVIESLVAASILALALAGLAYTFDTARALTRKSQNESEASGIAQREIESALGLAYADTRPTSTSGGSGWTSTAATIGLDTSTEVPAGSTGLARTGTWTGRSGVTGTVYRYVTWVQGTNQSLKRITVAVTAPTLAKPVVLSVYDQDPQVGPGGVTSGQTPCAAAKATCDP